MLFIDYLPAELKANKSRWYVSYHAKNPQSGKLHRKTIKVNRVKSLTERKKYAQKLVLEINKKLENGWNPFLEQEAPKSFTKLTTALEIFLKHKTKEFDSDDSIRTYKSMIKTLTNYIENFIKEPNLLVLSFNNTYVNNYMNYLFIERNIANKTYNNYKKFLVSAWNWLIENQYCKANPFMTVSKKMIAKKTRQIIDAGTRTRIKDYLIQENKKEFLAIIMLCFHGLIRPKEICLLKPDNIRLNERIIFLTPEMTKDNDTRIVSISTDLSNYLEKLNLDKINKEHYIFSTKFKPGKHLINSRDIGREWTKLRNELKFSKTYQFYSLKDSGIVQMLMDGISPIEVRNQAGHSSLEQTNEYAKYVNPTGSQQIKDRATDF